MENVLALQMLSTDRTGVEVCISKISCISVPSCISFPSAVIDDIAIGGNL